MLKGKHKQVYNFLSTNRERTWKWEDNHSQIMFIDSLRFMSSSLSSQQNSNKSKSCKLCLHCIKAKDKYLTFMCLKCNKNHIIFQ